MNWMCIIIYKAQFQIITNWIVCCNWNTLNFTYKNQRLWGARVVTHFSTHFLSSSDSIFLISKRLAYLLGLFHAIKTCFLTHCSTMLCVIIAKRRTCRITCVRCAPKRMCGLFRKRRLFDIKVKNGTFTWIGLYKRGTCFKVLGNEDSFGLEERGTWEFEDRRKIRNHRKLCNITSDFVRTF